MKQEIIDAQRDVDCTPAIQETNAEAHLFQASLDVLTIPGHIADDIGRIGLTALATAHQKPIIVLGETKHHQERISWPKGKRQTTMFRVVLSREVTDLLRADVEVEALTPADAIATARGQMEAGLIELRYHQPTGKCGPVEFEVLTVD